MAAADERVIGIYAKAGGITIDFTMVAAIPRRAGATISSKALSGSARLRQVVGNSVAGYAIPILTYRPGRPGVAEAHVWVYARAPPIADINVVPLNTKAGHWNRGFAPLTSCLIAYTDILCGTFSPAVADIWVSIRNIVTSVGLLIALIACPSFRTYASRLPGPLIKGTVPVTGTNIGIKLPDAIALYFGLAFIACITRPTYTRILCFTCSIRCIAGDIRMFPIAL